MNQHICQICNRNFKSKLSEIRHVSQAHNKTSKEYYDLFYKKEIEDVCPVCNKETKFLNIVEGYTKTCSHKCACTLHRKNLAADSEKFQKFKEVVSINQRNIWKNRTNEENVIIRSKIAKTSTANNSKLTKEELAIKYGRYHTCDDETIDRLNRLGAEQCIKNIQNQISGYHKAMKGKFKPNNPKKYKGDPTNIIYRSSYEFKLMTFLDANPNVLQWNSEEVIIPYRSPIDGRIHRYYVDFWVEQISSDGKNEILLIEVKPLVQCSPPKLQKKQTKTYVNAVTTWLVNEAKWKAAESLCESRGWKWQIITEKELFGRSS